MKIAIALLGRFHVLDLAREFAGNPLFVGSLPRSRDQLSGWATASGQLQDSQ